MCLAGLVLALLCGLFPSQILFWRGMKLQQDLEHGFWLDELLWSKVDALSHSRFCGTTFTASHVGIVRFG
ncbi:unnamed protein product [Lathyrus sativus]|nr:unnamed protein product [Lathyrus sativus]